VILFFDEADALFSKRTDVTSSNDKHANTEVAFLLQKIEQHEGVTFLATNRFNDFDVAFIRRINYAVRIERPDAATRLKLYEKILPKKTPKADDINLKYYADNFEISGSEIKEVLYSAAFMAAADNKCLSNKHILQALKLQQEKTGKIVSGAEISRFIM
jgi:SpoVK/Ycf46/Vps4 family AAA+-type ATPase